MQTSLFHRETAVRRPRRVGGMGGIDHLPGTRIRIHAAVETVAAGPASDRLVPAVNPTPAECRACGACCFSLSPTFVRVDGRWQIMAKVFHYDLI